MDLRFERKAKMMRRRRALRVAVTVISILLALVIAGVWIIIEYHANEEPAQTDASQPMIEKPEFGEQDVIRLLLILTDVDHERFALVTADPAGTAVRVTAFAPDAPLENGATPRAVYRKSGAAAVAASIAARLQLPSVHYFAMSGQSAVNWFNYLEKGIEITLPQAVHADDSDGVLLRLEAGEQNLTATQTVGLLRYDGWNDPAAGTTVCADIVVSMINRYFRSGRDLSGDFAALCNMTQTDLRIGDFSAARERLEYLAAQNTGMLCSCAPAVC